MKGLFPSNLIAQENQKERSRVLIHLEGNLSDHNALRRGIVSKRKVEPQTYDWKVLDIYIFLLLEGRFWSKEKFHYKTLGTSFAIDYHED